MAEVMARLEPLVSAWTIRIAFPGQPAVEGGRMDFAWMKGKQFLVQRWEVPVPEAPDGLAVIGFDEDRDAFLQYYFDSRGVARVYQMSVVDGVWKLWREESDISPLDFAQRFTATFSEDGDTISGAWEIAHDLTTWDHDFDLSYLRVR